MKNFHLRFLWLGLELICCLALPAQNLHTLWQKVERAAAEDNPQEVILQSGKLYELAKKKKNVPEMLRAYLTRMSWRQQVSPDSLETDKQEFLKWADHTDNLLDQSLLYFLYGIISEKNGESYLKKAVALETGSESLLPLLASTSSLNYKPVVIEGESSKLFQHDLLSLYRQTLEQYVWKFGRESWMKELLLRDIDFYQRSGKIKQALSVFLEWDDNRYQISLPVDRKKFLNQLVLKYEGQSACAEVERRLAEEMPTKEAIHCLQQAIKRYSDYERLDELKSDLENRICPSASFHSSTEVYPQKTSELNYSVYNVSSFQIRWLRLDDSVRLQATLSSDLEGMKSDKNLKNKVMKAIRWSSTPTIYHITEESYARKDSVIQIKNPEVPGFYLLEVTPLECTDYPTSKVVPDYLLKVVTKWFPLAIPVNDKENEIQVLDSWTGTPIPQTSVKCYERNNSDVYQEINSFTTDNEGKFLCQLQGRKTLYWAVEKENGCSYISRLSSYFHKASEIQTQHRLNIFCDRSIYRPGQEVKYSLLLWNQIGDSVFVDSRQSVTVVLQGGRKWNELRRDTLTTDSYGAAEGCFILPSDCTPGNYTLQSQYGSVNIKVEEYKRPTFDVQWEPYARAYAKGDTLHLKGSAFTFTDLPIQHASVLVKTICKQQRWWRTINQSVTKVDTLSTDENGEFEIAIPLILPQNFENMQEERLNSFVDFEIEMAVTSQTGETHSSTIHFPVSSSPLLFWVDGDQREDKEHLKNWAIHLTNLKQEDQKREIRLELFSVPQKQLIWKGVQESGRDFCPDFLKELPSGKYQLRCSYDTLKVDKPILLFSLKDSHPIEKTPLWTYAEKDTYGKGENITIQFGTSLERGFIQYYIHGKKGLLSSGSCQLTDSLSLMHVPYDEKFKDGIEISYVIVKEGYVHSSSLKFSLIAPEKELKTEWISFRDYSQPGKREIWKLKLTLPNGKPADANLLAVLYDSSLDKLYRHSWNLSIPLIRLFPYHTIGFTSNRSSAYLTFPSGSRYQFKDRNFDRLDDSLIPSNYPIFRMNDRMPVKLMAARSLAKNEMESPMLAASATMDIAVSETSEDSSIDKEELEQNLRNDFQETAYFSSSLYTNKEGVVTLEFVLPQSITEWRLLGVAHTKAMEYTSHIDKTVKAVKSFMAQPNMPRYIRVGDQVQIPISIRNLSGTEQKGTVYFILKDSTMTKELIFKKASFRVGSSDEQIVRIDFKAPNYVGGSICQVYAKSEQYSDGEQHELPILSDKVWLQENRAYYLNSASKDVILKDMLNQGSLWNGSSTMLVQIVHNPIWKVIQDVARKSQNAVNQNVVDLALDYYSQTLSAAIASQQPTINLHTAMAGDTLSAKKSLLELEKLQQSDGGFSWYLGMHSSPYMTRLVAESLIRLSSLHITVPDSARFNRIIRRSMYYLDQRMLAYYQQVKKEKGIFNEEVIHYLYLCCLNPHLQSKECGKAIEYFVNQLPNSLKSLTIYERAMASMALHHYGNEKEAQKFLRSIVSYSVYTEELGRYYDSPKATYSWRNYRIPTQTRVINALAEIAPLELKITEESQAFKKDSLLQDYSRWLLDQKRTQDWGNSTNTLDALYALLYKNYRKILASNDDAAEETYSYSYKEFSHMPEKWTLRRKESDSPVAWATVTMNSLVNLIEAEAESVHTGFQLKVNYLKEKVQDGQVSYQSLEMEQLHVGDKIRAVLSVQVDRDMDFVELNLPRPACLNTVSDKSGYRYGKGIPYYYIVRDEASCFCMDHLPKGHYELSEDYYVGLKGVYTSGIPKIQCVYAPEFSTHGESATFVIK